MVFPAQSLGLYFSQTEPVPFMRQWPGHDRGRKAEGRCIAAKTEVIRLETSSASGNYLPLLTRLRPGTIQILSLDGALINHGNLKYILAVPGLIGAY